MQNKLKLEPYGSTILGHSELRRELLPRHVQMIGYVLFEKNQLTFFEIIFPIKTYNYSIQLIYGNIEH